MGATSPGCVSATQQEGAKKNGIFRGFAHLCFQTLAQPLASNVISSCLILTAQRVNVPLHTGFGEFAAALPDPLPCSRTADTAPWAAAKNFPFHPCKIWIQVSWTFPLSVPSLMKQLGCRERVEQNPKEWESQSDQPEMSQSFSHFGKVRGQVRSSHINPRVTLNPLASELMFLSVSATGEERGRCFTIEYVMPMNIQLTSESTINVLSKCFGGLPAFTSCKSPSSKC